MTAPSSRHVLPRSMLGRFVLCVSCSVWGSGIGGLGVALVWPNAAWAGAFIGLAVGIYRGLSIRVVADDEGLKVRNAWRTRRIAWRDVSQIYEAAPWQLKGCPCPAIRSAEGKVVMWALAYGDRGTSSEPTERAKTIAKKLNELATTRGVSVQGGVLLKTHRMTER